VYSFTFHLTIYLCPYMWFVIIVFLCRCGLWGSKYACMCICVYRCLCAYVCVCVCVCVCVQLFSSRIYSWKLNCWVKKNGYLTYMHLLCIKQITNENLLYSAGNSTQCFVVTQMGGNPEKRGYMYVDTDFTLLYSRN